MTNKEFISQEFAEMWKRAGVVPFEHPATGLQLVVNKPSRTDATKKHNARVMKKWKMGAL